MTKLFVDDIREAPDDTWIVARNYREAVQVLQKGFVHEMSLDHDLGEAHTGYDIVCYLESQLRCGNIANYNCVISVHSANFDRKDEPAANHGRKHWSLYLSECGVVNMLNSMFPIPK